jgi:predicted ferric reductase
VTTSGAATATRRASQLLLLRRIGLMALYVGVAVAPLGLALLGPHPPGRGFWVDVAFGLGLVGLSMLGLQFLSVARIARVDAPYGIDAVMRYHRQAAYATLAVVVAHPLLLLTQSAYRTLLDPFDAPARVLWGWAALAAFAVTVVLARYRLRLRVSYELWRVSHGILAVVVASAALVHVRSVGAYVAADTWKETAWTVWVVVFMGLLAYVRVVKPMVRLRRPWLIEEVVPQPGNTVSLRLRPEGHGGLRFRAGQFAWITIAGVPFDQHEHPFSISSAATRPARIEFTVKALGDFTAGMADVAGRRAWLEGPYGNFGIGWDSASHLVLIAGGVGITPIMSILRTMADLGDRRRVTVVYGNKTWDTTIFADELDALTTRLDLHVVHVIEQPHEGWTGRTGFINQQLLEELLPVDASGVQCYVCGPPPMMAAVERALIAARVPPRQIHAELFTFA